MAVTSSYTGEKLAASLKTRKGLLASDIFYLRCIVAERAVKKDTLSISLDKGSACKYTHRLSIPRDPFRLCTVQLPYMSVPITVPIIELCR